MIIPRPALPEGLTHEASVLYFKKGVGGLFQVNDTANFTGEKTAIPNLNSIRSFDVVDEIKAIVNSLCHGNVVSCADILAVATRDFVEIVCPANGGDNKTAPLDSSTALFDTVYFKALLVKKGLLHSDQELFKGASDSDNLVRHYANNPNDFAVDFGPSMIKMGNMTWPKKKKMGNMKPLTGSDGEIRLNCRKIN